MHHRHHHGSGHGSRLFRGGFPSRHELLERLENHQRDLEQQLADIADVITHLRDRDDAQPQAQA
ncbi:MAG: hypothetical protein ACRDLM_01895 [Gaiellaceae bacterium]